MPPQVGVGTRHPPDGLPNARRHRGAGAFGSRSRPASPTAQAKGQRQLLHQRLPLGSDGGRAFDVASRVGLVSFCLQLHQPLAVVQACFRVESLAHIPRRGEARFGRTPAAYRRGQVQRGHGPARLGQELREIAQALAVRQADFAYVNEGTLEELDAFVADVLARVS